MAMLRSMDSAISGMQSNQTAMDVIGNNIANVNTVGYKANRVTFEEAMAQLMQGATQPVGNMGGINPLQVGLGTSVGSIDTMLDEGTLQTTGQITDLAIQGKSYFVYSNGSGDVYSRNGALNIDANGNLVSSTNGYCLQGMMAADNGTYPAGTKIGNIKIPYGEKAAANATTEVSYQCNLDSDSEALGTVTHTSQFLAAADGAQTLTSLNDENGNSLGIQAGDTLTLSMTGAADQTLQVGAAAGQINSLDDLANAIGAYTGGTVAIANGQLTLTNGTGAAINGLQIKSSRPISDSYVANAFNFGSSIADGGTDTTGTLLRPAVSTDLMANVLDSTGQALGLEDGDVIKINGAIGGSSIAENDLTYAAATTTVNDVLTAIQGAFHLPATDGTLQNNPSVSINAADSPDDLLPDGSIVVRGQPETAFAISSISITATDSNNTTPSPTRFIANMPFTSIQDARDTGVHSTSIQVYDQSGDAHTLVMTFTHSEIPNDWLWQATTEGGEQILGGNTGHITFGQDGSPDSFTYDDGSTNFRFDPMNGSNIVSINLNTGTPGSLTGVTQFRSDTTTIAKSQDGYPMGKLQEISIDEKGEISGVYTNGVTKSIARVIVADFNNPAGLLKLSDSMYAYSNNSGLPALQRPGVGSMSTIKSGALEMSNVDLATEFTNMITTERAYQANSRVITTCDTLLQELVNLIR